jgi:hypothetical protein
MRKTIISLVPFLLAILLTGCVTNGFRQQMDIFYKKMDQLKENGDSLVAEKQRWSETWKIHEEKEYEIISDFSDEQLILYDMLQNNDLSSARRLIAKKKLTNQLSNKKKGELEQHVKDRQYVVEWRTDLDYRIEKLKRKWILLEKEMDNFKENYFFLHRYQH